MERRPSDWRLPARRAGTWIERTRRIANAAWLADACLRSVVLSIHGARHARAAAMRRNIHTRYLRYSVPLVMPFLHCPPCLRIVLRYRTSPTVLAADELRARTLPLYIPHEGD